MTRGLLVGFAVLLGLGVLTVATQGAFLPGLLFLSPMLKTTFLGALGADIVSALSPALVCLLLHVSLRIASTKKIVLKSVKRKEQSKPKTNNDSDNKKADNISESIDSSPPPTYARSIAHDSFDNRSHRSTLKYLQSYLSQPPKMMK